MITIFKIDWLSKKAKEAEVYISDGNFCFVCFSHPFNYSVGDNATLPVYTLNAKNICRLIGDEVFSAERVSSGFEYNLTGRVINKDCNQIQIGEIIIELDVPFANDIKLNNFVSLTCDRIDLY